MKTALKRFDGRPTKAKMDGTRLVVPFDEFSELVRHKGIRADAGESAFTALALSYVEPFVYETVLPPLEGRAYAPVDNSAPAGSLSTRYRMFTRTGAANFVTGGVHDYPSTSFFVKEFAHNFYKVGASYHYTMFDLAAAAVAATNGGPPINIDLEDALAAREAIERKLDRIAAFGSTDAGDPSIGLLGLLNQPNANMYVLAVGGAGFTDWARKTPDEVIADITGIIASQVAVTFKRFRPTLILLPILQHETIAGRTMGDGRSDTILSYAMRTRKESGTPIDIRSWQYCTGAGVGPSDRMVAYEPNKRYVRHMISREFTQAPPFMHGFEIDVDCVAESAGVFSPYPISISYGDAL